MAIAVIGPEADEVQGPVQVLEAGVIHLWAAAGDAEALVLPAKV